MKRLTFFLTALIYLFGCSSDSDRIKGEIDELEQQAQALRQEREGLIDENDSLKRDNDLIRNKIDSLELALDKCYLKSMKFLLADNPMQLTCDVTCDIIGDSVVECWIPNVTSDKMLTPCFEFEGTDVAINGQKTDSRINTFNFTPPQTLLVTSRLKSKSYTVYVHSFTGLPILWIDTNDRESLSYDNNYRHGKLKLIEDGTTFHTNGTLEENIEVRHEGDFETYVPMFDGKAHTGKNAYSFIFNKEVALMGEPANRNWELLPNNDEATMLRTSTMFYLGSISTLSYTPCYHYVELFLNGRYNGTYMISDKVEAGTGRIDVGSNGFILNVGPTTSSSSFRTNRIDQPINIIEPRISRGDDNYTYISDFVTTAEKALFGEDFTNEDSGWQKYIDMDSFVDWYIINEIVMSKEAAFRSDCYLSLIQGGKLKIGPLCRRTGILGSNPNTPTGLVMQSSAWYNRLLQDPAFTTKVKERYTYFYQAKPQILQAIDNNAQYLMRSAVENSNRWSIFKTVSFDATKIQYQQEVKKMEDWLDTRMDWLYRELNK